MDSILTSIKKLMGMPEEYTAFDQDLIIHINSVFNILYQMGIGPSGFSIQDETSLWSDYLGTTENLELIKTYVYLKVRLAFDPPTNSSLLGSMNEMIKEYEWRLYITENPTNTFTQ